MQVYRHLDVGSNKASPEERAAVRHHLLDVIDPDERFTAGRFVRDADAAIAEILAGDLARLVGHPLQGDGRRGGLHFHHFGVGVGELVGVDALMFGVANGLVPAAPMRTLTRRRTVVYQAASANKGRRSDERVVRNFHSFEKWIGESSVAARTVCIVSVPPPDRPAGRPRSYRIAGSRW